MKTSHFNNIINILTSESRRNLYKNLYEFLIELNIGNFIIWEVENNIAEPKLSKNFDFNLDDVSADIYDLGFNGNILNKEKIEFDFFDINFEIYEEVFLIHNKVVTSIITFRENIKSDSLNILLGYSEKIAQRLFELDAMEKHSEIFVDYQKKIDFLKSSSSIFSSIDIESLINTAQDFFMSVFSAEASCVLFENLFSGIGIKEEDINKNIKIKGLYASEYLKQINNTEYIFEEIETDKFIINNCFIIHDEKHYFTVVLFNIHVDLVPDKELSELISSIVSIALDNAKNHEKMTALKIEESEMEKTIDILNKFVPGEINLSGEIEVHGVNYPAKKTGGDYFYLLENQGKIFFCLADVCGKGYDAAIVTVVLSVINEFFTKGKISTAMSKMLKDMNSFILSKNLDGRFVTAFFGIFDKEKYEMEYISLGHEPCVLLSKDGSYKLIESNYLPIGITVENYESERIKINKGEKLFVYSDGIIEYIDYPQLCEYLAENYNENSKVLISKLYKILVGDDTENQKDDFTCMMLEF